MSYTVLRVVDRGVVLLAGHEERFARGGPEALDAFRRFAASSRRRAPGIYALTWAQGRLDVRVRAASSLFEGMPVRYLPSPLVLADGPIHKTPPPNPYTAVRVPGVATLLTSADGGEIYESCAAAVLAWDGESLVAPPAGTPCLISTAAGAIARAARVRGAPIRKDSSWPCALVNAVGGLVVPGIPGRDVFPDSVRRTVAGILEATTQRP